jgi:hypothetical protein
VTFGPTDVYQFSANSFVLDTVQFKTTGAFPVTISAEGLAEGQTIYVRHSVVTTASDIGVITKEKAKLDLTNLNAYKGLVVLVLVDTNIPPGATPADNAQSPTNKVTIRITGSEDCINDPSTGLCWDKMDSTAVWTGAGTYCSGKGTRLPTIQELVLFATEGAVQFTVHDTTGGGTSGGQEFLFGTSTDLRPRLWARGYESYAGYLGEQSQNAYWSSTTFEFPPQMVGSVDSAWHLVFSGGIVGPLVKHVSRTVRCVRARR